MFSDTYGVTGGSSAVKAQRAIGELQYHTVMRRDQFERKYGTEILDRFRWWNVAYLLPGVDRALLDQDFRVPGQEIMRGDFYAP